MELIISKSILYKNTYPRDFIECIKEFSNRVLTSKIVLSKILKKDLMIVLAYSGKLSLQIHAKINRVKKNKLPYCNFRIVFHTKCKLINFFTIKDTIPVLMVLALFINLCVVAAVVPIIAKTKHHFKVRMCEHLEVSALTGKTVKGDNNSVIKEHHLSYNHLSDFKDFSILASNNNDFKVTLMGSLLINRDIKTDIR